MIMKQKYDNKLKLLYTKAYLLFHASVIFEYTKNIFILSV